jgi:hypothetical protein
MRLSIQIDYEMEVGEEDPRPRLVIVCRGGKCEPSRSEPMALCVALDRSVSMMGTALENARSAAKIIARNLGPDDYFALVAFDEEAETLVPLRMDPNRERVYHAISAVQPGSLTNLLGGLALGYDELRKAPPGIKRRLLLLSDGISKVGIQDPDRIVKVAELANLDDGVATSCLGFGCGIREEFLEKLSEATGGQFYGADFPESLPSIIESELGGLQKITAQNVRILLKRMTGCACFEQTIDHHQLDMLGQGVQFSLGDLLSGEMKAIVLRLDMVPVSPSSDRLLPSLFENEPLLKAEILYDEFTDEGIVAHRITRSIRRVPEENDEGTQETRTTVIWDPPVEGVCWTPVIDSMCLNRDENETQ